MKQDTEKDKDYFDGFDFEKTPSIKHPLVQKIQNPPIDAEALQWLNQQPAETQGRVNDFIKSLMNS